MSGRCSTTRQLLFALPTLVATAACELPDADPDHGTLAREAETISGPAAPLRGFQQTAAAGEEVGETEPLVVLAGNYGPRLPGLYGTDLGWSFKHGNKLWMLFGDSWGERERYFIGAPVTLSDDALGFISLDEFGDGDSVEAHIRSNPLFAELGWRAAKAPEQPSPDEADRALLQIAPREGAQPIQLWGGGWAAMNMGPGLTPLTGFSNARRDEGAGAFGIFFRNAHKTCQNGACSNGFSCDTGLGRCVRKGEIFANSLSMACVIADVQAQQVKRDDCFSCAPVGGICQDKKSSMYDTTPRGRVSAVVVTHEVGSALGSNNLTADPIVQFNTRPWNTHRFFNAMARTVNDFDATRAEGMGNDYTSADGIDTAREGVFIWGRPHFGGLTKERRDVQLYLAWVPMPAYANNGNFGWTPKYFAGLDAQGRPRFVDREVDSVALNLSGPAEEPSREELDVVGQMSVSFIPSLGRWVMIYGGGLSQQFGELIFGSDWSKELENGALQVRSAAHPWGPWTAPKPLLVPGDPDRAEGLFAEGNILHSPSCVGAGCVVSEAAWSNPGGLYGPNIIEPWTEPRSGAVDLYWNLSTWNPYEVVLMKTTLRPSDLQ